MNWLYAKRVYVAIGALITLLGIGGTVIAIDSRYAKAESYKQITETLQKLNARIDQQTMLEVQRRIWQLENEYRDKPMPVYVTEELTFLKLHLKRLSNEK